MRPIRFPSALCVLIPSLLLCACGSDQNIADSARCDGILNSTENTVDDLFDVDGDGYFDAENSACQETYDTTQLDCDDSDGTVNPGELEVGCNGLDDDCDPATPDEGDNDGDGVDVCSGDCDDNNPDVSPDEDEVVCDGLDNDCDEETADESDEDADGFSSCEDCDDDNELVNPGTTEVQCNGFDDDCNELTDDGDDLDGDGMNHCFDCDDNDPLRFPGNPEVCEDDVDQDCDGSDATCPADWNGVWDTSTVSYACAFDSVVIGFNQFLVSNSGSSISFTSLLETVDPETEDVTVESSTQPGTMSGTLTGQGFAVSLVIPGGCEEAYSLAGSFTGDDTFSATLTATFTGVCWDCASQSWLISGSR